MVEDGKRLNTDYGMNSNDVINHVYEKGLSGNRAAKHLEAVYHRGGKMLKPATKEAIVGVIASERGGDAYYTAWAREDLANNPIKGFEEYTKGTDPETSRADARKVRKGRNLLYDDIQTRLKKKGGNTSNDIALIDKMYGALINSAKEGGAHTAKEFAKYVTEYNEFKGGHHSGSDRNSFMKEAREHLTLEGEEVAEGLKSGGLIGRLHVNHLAKGMRSARNSLDKYWPPLSLLGIGASIFFLSSNITGNAISTLSNTTSSLIGAGLLVVGLVAGFFWLKINRR